MAEGHNRRGPGVRTLIGWALVVGLAAVGGGVAAAFAPSTSLLWRVGGAAVGGAVGLVAVFLADQGNQRSEAKAAALHARGEVLDALVADPASEGSVFDVLLATSTEAAPFRGRKDELAGLEWWWDDPKRAVVVVTGPAGTGKTRLVTEFAKGRPAPWISGWLRADRGGDAVAAIAACGDPALILVDDADQRADVAALLTSLNADRGTGPTARVILVSRAPGLLRRLAPTLDDRSRGMLEGIRELPLGPFGSADDRVRWFAEAVRAYASARQTPPPDLPAHLSGYVTDPAEPILTLQAQALLAVLESERSRPWRSRSDDLPFDQVAAALFAHEEHRWQKSRPGFGLTDLTSPVQARAVAILLLASPAEQDQAVAALRWVPELADAPTERRANIASWVAHLYASDPPWPIHVKPDMLAEWFVVAQLTGTPALADLLHAMTPTRKDAVLVLLAHASDHIPQAVQLFADVVAADVPYLAEAGMAAALTASVGQWRLDGELASLIRQTIWSADTLGRIENRLTLNLPQTGAAAAEARVKLARADGDAASLARALTDLGYRLGNLGHYQEALEATEESVSLWRPLARDDASHQPGLAAALDGLGIALEQMGRDWEALEATEESVSLWRPLARDDAPHQSSLASALGNLGNHLTAVGRDREALEVTEETVSLYRQLARDNPAHQHNLALGLDTRGIRLGNLDRYEEALEATEESVSLWRPLARDNPAHRAELATALSNLGIELAKMGRDREALEASEESVSLRRPLARDNPAHRADLATALINLGFRLDAMSRYREAQQAFEESVSLRRPLARENPAHQPPLATALDGLGIALAKMDRDREALEAAEESIDIYRRLVRDNPAHRANLAGAMANLGNRLDAMGRYQDGVEATQEAISLYRPLARDNPAHRASLATVLQSLGIKLTRMGRYQEAMQAKKESVEFWRALAAENPNQYQETYKRQLAQLQRDVDLYGKEAASRGPRRGDIPDKDEPHHIPPIPELPEG